VSSYQVKEIVLTDKKEILLKGQALPNTYITIYIYSTPIIITVRTDSNGEWQYVLDKELEDGKHTVYTATVNNTGNIIAKSSPFLFTKTAEAASLGDVPLLENTPTVNEPTLLENESLYIVLGSVLAFIIMILILVGIISKKDEPTKS
jgi:hypothetical protein